MKVIMSAARTSPSSGRRHAPFIFVPSLPYMQFDPFSNLLFAHEINIPEKKGDYSGFKRIKRDIRGCIFILMKKSAQAHACALFF